MICSLFGRKGLSPNGADLIWVMTSKIENETNQYLIINQTSLFSLFIFESKSSCLRYDRSLLRNNPNYYLSQINPPPHVNEYILLLTKAIPRVSAAKNHRFECIANTRFQLVFAFVKVPPHMPFLSQHCYQTYTFLRHPWMLGA